MLELLGALTVIVAATPVKVATTSWTVSGVDQPVGAAMLDRFATQLGATGAVKVTTRNDIEQALGLERQRQLLGCSDGGCLAELAGALGVDAVLTGSVVRVGKQLTVTLRAVAASSGQEIASAPSDTTPRRPHKTGSIARPCRFARASTRR